MVVRALAEPDEVEGLARLGAEPRLLARDARPSEEDLPDPDASPLVEADHHIVERRPVRKEVVLLEYDRHVLAQGDHLGVPVQTVDRVRADVDFAAVDADEAVDAAKQRRFPRAGRSDDADRFASADVERDSAQHLDGAERLVHVDHPDDRWRSGGGDWSVRHEINRLCWQAPQPARRSRAARAPSPREIVPAPRAQSPSSRR